MAKHRKTIKTRIKSNTLHCPAFNVQQVEIEIASLVVIDIGRKYNVPAIGMPVGSKVGGTIPCQLDGSSLGEIHDVEIQLPGTDQSLP